MPVIFLFLTLIKHGRRQTVKSHFKGEVCCTCMPYCKVMNDQEIKNKTRAGDNNEEEEWLKDKDNDKGG